MAMNSKNVNFQIKEKSKSPEVKNRKSGWVRRSSKRLLLYYFFISDFLRYRAVYSIANLLSFI